MQPVWWFGHCIMMLHLASLVYTLIPTGSSIPMLSLSLQSDSMLSLPPFLGPPAPQKESHRLWVPIFREVASQTDDFPTCLLYAFLLRRKSNETGEVREL